MVSRQHCFLNLLLIVTTTLSGVSAIGCSSDSTPDPTGTGGEAGGGAAGVAGQGGAGQGGAGQGGAGAAGKGGAGAAGKGGGGVGGGGNGGAGGQVAQLVAISVDPGNFQLIVGATQQLTVKGIYGDGTQKTETATFTSSDATVAVVSAAGLVTGIKPGAAMLTAKVGNLTTTASTTVLSASLEIQPGSTSIAKSTTVQFSALAKTSNGTSQDVTQTAGWTSSDPAIVTIGDATGLATGVATGAVTITKTYGGQTATATLVVTQAAVVALQISPAAPPPIPVGATSQFSVTGIFTDGSKQDLSSLVTWSSSAPASATISAKGLLTGVAGGTTSVGASLGATQASPVSVVVNGTAKLSYLTVFPSALQLTAGQSAQATATGHYDDGSVASVTSTATWSALDGAGSPTTAFTVAGGLVTGVASTAGVAGQARATIGGIQGSVAVTVKETAITNISVVCGAGEALSCLPAGIGYPVSCVATAVFKDGTTGDITGSAAWASTDTTVASTPIVAGGKATTTLGVAGTAALTASQAGVASPSTDALATLQTAALALSSITVSPLSATIARGQAQRFKATGAFAPQGACVEPAPRGLSALVTWGSNLPQVAAVDNSAGSEGIVAGLLPGTATISAVLGSVSGAGQLTVTGACLQAVAIDQSNPTYPANVLAPLSVKAFYSDAPQTPVAVPAGSMGSWSSAAVDPDSWFLTVGAASPDALVFSVSEGACSGTVQATTTVTVDASATLSGRLISPFSATIAAGGHQDFIARATFSGHAESFNVTPFASWDQNPSLGLAHEPVGGVERFTHTGAMQGSTLISAAYGSRTAQGSLTVKGSTIKGISVDGFAPATDTPSVPAHLRLVFSATVTFSDGTTVKNPSGMSFTSSNPSRLAFTPGSSAATTLTPGDVAVTAGYFGIDSGAFPLKVNAGALVALGFDPISPMVMPKNASAPLVVTGAYDNGQHFDVSGLVLVSSGNTAIVTTSQGVGSLSVKSGATVTASPVQLTFSKDTVSTTYDVNVESASCYTSVIISPSSIAVGVGEQFKLSALAIDSTGGGTIVSNLGTWGASDDRIVNLGLDTPTFDATLKNTYLAKTKGSSTASFTLTGLNVCAGGDVTKTTIGASSSVTVTDATIASVSILPGAVSPAVSRRIPLGERLGLQAIAIFSDGSSRDVAGDAGTTWGSQAPQIASLDANGVLHGNMVGQTIVSLGSVNGKQATMLVQVEDCGVPAVSINTSDSRSLPIGSVRDYSATALYPSTVCDADHSERLYAITDRALFASSLPSVATIGSYGANPGRALAVKAGTTQISASYRGNVSNSLGLSAVDVTLKELHVSAPAVTYKNGTFVIGLTARYQDSKSNIYDLPPPAVSWAIGDSSIVSIDATGKLRGLVVGSTDYFAQVGTIISEKLAIKVSSACITGVAMVSPGSDVTWPGGVPFGATVSCTTSDGSTLPCAPVYSVTGTSSALVTDEDFATSGRGHVSTSPTAIGATAAIVATIPVSAGACDDGVPRTAKRTVVVGNSALNFIHLTPGFASIARGTKRAYAAFGVFLGGTGAGTYSLTSAAAFSSANESVATPDNDGTGNITASSIDGSTLISASYLGVTSNDGLLIVSGKLLSSLAITADLNLVGGPRTAASYPAGGFVLQLHATGRYSDGTSADLTPSVAWSLSAPTQPGASIARAGLFTTGIAGGAQIIHAGLGQIGASFTVTQVGAPIVAVDIVDADGGLATASIPKGLSQDYGAQVTLNGATPGPFWATRNVTWATSAPASGPILVGLNSIVLSAQNLGTTNLTATRGTSTGGPLAVTITSAVPLSLSCQPATGAITVGDTEQLRAVVKSSDGTTNDVTTSADWSALSVHNVATVDDQGLATGTIQGVVTVTPGYLSLPSAGCVITVTP
jgi:hypothetical protein